jgi:hypothetical protein
MSRTFGHTKAQHKGCASYRTAKSWRSKYNRVVRHKNRVLAAKADANEDIVFVDRNETSAGNLWEHPGY